jgi:mRNA interferase RelE/StbE
MERYELRLKPSVTRDLRGIPADDVRRLLARLEALRDDPHPPGCEKLSTQGRYRVRPGDYWIVYSVTDADLVVEIVTIGHRRDVYRQR